MPYAPGVQDISGQLRAQGIAQAGNAWSQAIGNIGKDLGDAFQTYKQNQYITNQAMGQIAGYTRANPEVLKYLEGASSDDPNSPTLSPEVLKSWSKVKTGKVGVQDAAMVKSFLEAYDKNKADQLTRQHVAAQNAYLAAQTAALEAKPMNRNLFNVEELRKLYPADQWDVNAVPVAGAPGVVEVKSVNARAPKEDKYDKVVAGNEVLVFGKEGEVVKRIPVTPALPPGYQPAKAGEGIEAIPGGPVAKEEQAKAEKQRVTEAMSNAMTSDVNSAIDRAISRTSSATAGAGAYLSVLPGSQAKNLEGDLEQIKAIIGFDQLSKMRQASPTGGALGQVAVKELDFLQAVRGKLDQTKDPAELKRTLAQVKDSMNRLNMVMKGVLPEEKTPEKGGSTTNIGRFKVIAQ
jgi:hypothetical protein